MINPIELMRNLENIKSQAEEYKKKLPGIKCTGYAMGNLIEVVVTGEMKIESIKIDPSVISQDQHQMLEVLIASAVNNALDSLKGRLAQEASQMGQQYGLGNLGSLGGLGL